MLVNKDTIKALNAATTLIKYCNRYKNCDNCIFYSDNKFERITIPQHCAVNIPCNYKAVKNNDTERGQQNGER